MNDALNSARVIQPPASVASTATTTCLFDTVGFDYAIIDILSGTQSTTDAAITTIRVYEADTDTNTSSFSAVVALTGGTATGSTVGFVIPAVTVTGLGGGIQLQIDLRKRKRYLRLNMTPGTTLVMGAVVELSRAEQARLTAARKSVLNHGSTASVGVATIVNA